MENTLPDFDSLWDYGNPAATEARFQELVPAYQTSGNTGRYVELLSQIARAQGLQNHFQEGHATLNQVEDLLQAIPVNHRAQVRCLLERGRLHNSAGTAESAVPLFQEAWEQAKAAGLDALAVDAAHMLGIAEPPERQIEWTKTALELAERSEDPAARNWRASLYNNLGMTYLDLEQYEEALDVLEKALALRRERGSVETVRIARWAVARTLRSLGRVTEALMIQRELFAEWESVGKSAPYVYEELGECLLLLNQAEEAKSYLGRAYAELSRDPWLVQHESGRLERLARLSGSDSD